MCVCGSASGWMIAFAARVRLQMTMYLFINPSIFIILSINLFVVDIVLVYLFIPNGRNGARTTKKWGPDAIRTLVWCGAHEVCAETFFSLPIASGNNGAPAISYQNIDACTAFSIFYLFFRSVRCFALVSAMFSHLYFLIVAYDRLNWPWGRVSRKFTSTDRASNRPAGRPTNASWTISLVADRCLQSHSLFMLNLWFAKRHTQYIHLPVHFYRTIKRIKNDDRTEIRALFLFFPLFRSGLLEAFEAALNKN